MDIQHWITILTVIGAALGVLYGIYNIVTAVLKPFKDSIEKIGTESKKDSTEIKESLAEHKGEAKAFRNNTNQRLTNIEQKVERLGNEDATIKADIETVKALAIKNNNNLKTNPSAAA